MKKGCLISLTILLVIVIAGYICLRNLFHIKRVSKEEMIINYEEHKVKINEVVQYFDSILPSNSSVHIEFENKDVEIFHLTKNGMRSNNWSTSEIPVDSLINELGWTKKELYTLRQKLKDANTISIAGGERIHLGWFRTGPAMYGIEIHPEKLNPNEIEMNNDSCNSLFYKDNISFTFGGGAYGPDCFLKINDK